jgi:hypothetical protein
MSGSLKNFGYPLKARQNKVKPFVVSLSNHERLNRSPFDKGERLAFLLVTP